MKSIFLFLGLVLPTDVFAQALDYNVENPYTFSLGAKHHCAIRRDQALSCAGDNSFGQLGDGTMASRLNPVLVAVPIPVSRVEAGDRHTCAIVRTALYCWGANDKGQVGLAPTQTVTTPHRVLPRGVTQVSVRYNHTCAVVYGSVQCWGDNSAGQLGDGSTRASTIPVAVVGLHQRALEVKTGLDFSCALLQDGSVSCWGNGRFGQLGRGDTLSGYTAASVRGPLRFQMIQVGRQHACGVDQYGGVDCWGRGDRGQVGSAYRFRSNPIPIPVYWLGFSQVALSVGDDHNCVTLDNGSVQCWGAGRLGQLSPRTSMDSEFPQIAVPNSVLTVWANGNRTCVANQALDRLCWGTPLEGLSP